MERSYKFRLYPTKAQEQLIQKTFGCTRFVYNYYLNMRKTAYAERQETIDKFACSRDLTQLKKKLPWLAEVDDYAVRSAIDDLDAAYKNFFRRIRNHEKPGYPKFKSKKEHRKSYRSRNNGRNIKLFPKHIQLPKLGQIRCKISKTVEGRILGATVTQVPSGKYYVSIYCTDVSFDPLPKTHEAIGLDLGIKTLATASDGTKYPNHKYLSKSEKKLVKLQKQMTRKTRGSANWEKARIKFAKLHEHIANQRKDAMHKLSTELVRNYDTICVETLRVKHMMHDSFFAGFIADASWYEFRRQLEYKSGWYGKQTVAVDYAFPSTTMCSDCGELSPNVSNFNVRKWTCPHCGAQHDRDVNAAKNILNEGLRLLA